MSYQKYTIQSTHQALSQEEEIYANQDHIEWQETPISIYTQGEKLRVFDSDKGVDKPFLTFMERTVLCRLGQGKTREEIAKDLHISRHYVKTLCLRLKDKTARL